MVRIVGTVMIQKPEGTSYMSSKVEKLSSNQVKISFEIPAEEFDKAMQQAYLKERGKISIPGFRKGKAPRNVIEMHYGKGVFYEDALDELFPALYTAAIEENKLEPVDRPELDVQQMEAGKELQFSVTVFVKPDVTLGDYKAVKVEKTVAEVTDADVEAEIERARERNARFIDITDRPAKLDDEVNIDYAGFDGDNQFEGGTAQGYNLVLGSGSFIPGFEEQILSERRVAAERHVDSPCPVPDPGHNVVAEQRELVFDSRFKRVHDAVDGGCIRIFCKICQNFFQPVAGKETVRIGGCKDVVLCGHRPVIAGAADFLAGLDEHFVRVLFCNLAGFVFGVAVHHDDFVLVAGQCLVTETL